MLACLCVCVCGVTVYSYYRCVVFVVLSIPVGCPCRAPPTLPSHVPLVAACIAGSKGRCLHKNGTHWTLVSIPSITHCQNRLAKNASVHSPTRTNNDEERDGAGILYACDFVCVCAGWCGLIGCVFDFQYHILVVVVGVVDDSSLDSTRVSR